MAWATPTTAAGQILTDAIWNQSVRDNLLFLKDRVDNPPRALVTHNTTQSIANNTVTALAFNTEVSDSATLHDTVTNNSRITVPAGQGGWWYFSGFAAFASNATGQRQVALRLNGTTILGAQQVDTTAGSQETRLQTSFEGVFVAGDYMEVVVLQNSGGALNAATSPFFSGRRAA